MVVACFAGQNESSFRSSLVIAFFGIATSSAILPSCSSSVQCFATYCLRCITLLVSIYVCIFYVFFRQQQQKTHLKNHLKTQFQWAAPYNSPSCSSTTTSNGNQNIKKDAKVVTMWLKRQKWRQKWSKSPLRRLNLKRQTNKQIIRIEIDVWRLSHNRQPKQWREIKESRHWNEATTTKNSIDNGSGGSAPKKRNQTLCHHRRTIEIGMQSAFPRLNWHICTGELEAKRWYTHRTKQNEWNERFRRRRRRRRVKKPNENIIVIMSL